MFFISTVKCRFRIIEKDFLVFFSTKPIKPIHTLNHELFYGQHEKDLDITNRELQLAVLQFLDQNKDVGLVILDNLSSLAMIREDKSDDWRELFLPFLIQCRRRHVAVLIVHHTNKAGDQRGTGAREDHLDTSILLKPAGSEENDGANFKVEFTKSRGVYGDDIDPFSAKLIKSQNGLFDWAIGDVDGKVKNRLLKLIREYGSDGITVTESADELGVTKGAISKAKSVLIDGGEIKAGKRMKLK